MARFKEGLVGATNKYDIPNMLMTRLTEVVFDNIEFGGPIKLASRSIYPEDGLSMGDCLDALDGLGGDLVYVGNDSFNLWALYVRGDGVAVALHAECEEGGLMRGAIKLDVYGPRGVDEGVVFEFLEAFGGKARGKAASKSGVTISYAYPTAGGVSILRKDAGKLPFSGIEGNYTASVRPVIWDLIGVLKEADRGLVTISGPPGTGKTWLLRSIITELDGRDTLICMPPSEFITNGHTLIEAISRVNRPVVVFEDLGNLFAQDYRRGSPDAFSTFLNMADGLLSLLSKAVFVLTFNEKIGRMDEAMTRPGRCLGNIEIPHLTFDEARGLLPEEHKDKLTGADTSLARVYSLMGREQLATKHDDPGTGFLALRGRDCGRGAPAGV